MTGRAARTVTAIATEQDTGEAGAQLDISLRLIAALESLDGAVRGRGRDLIPWEDCHPVDLFPLASSSAVPLIDERWQPRQGWTWQVLLLTVTFGAGATSAVVYTTADASGLIPSNSRKSFLPDTANMATWEPKGLLLGPGSQLSWLSAGGGITVSGLAVEVRTHLLPLYLM